MTPKIGRELTGIASTKQQVSSSQTTAKHRQQDTILAAAQASLDKEEAKLDLSAKLQGHVRDRSRFIKTGGHSLHIDENDRAFQTLRRISSLYQSDMQEADRIRREAREITNRKGTGIGLRLQDIQEISLRHVGGSPVAATNAGGGN